MEQEQIMAVSLALIANELRVDPSELQVLRFREVSTGTLDTYLEENGISFHQYQLGDEA